MNCHVTRELLSAYFDGELAHHQLEQVEQHLDVCGPCQQELAGFRSLRRLTQSVTHPTPPAAIWDEVSRRLVISEPKVTLRRRVMNWQSLSMVGLAAAAILLVVTYAGRLVKPVRDDQQTAHHHIAQFVSDFSVNPDRAQQALLASFHGKPASDTDLSRSLHYQLISSKGPPQGYTVQGAFTLDMPCCRCSQTLLHRRAGGTVAVFEHHAAEHPDWLRGFGCENGMCGDVECQISPVGGRLAVSCQVGDRHFTIVGAGNRAEVETLVAWLGGVVDTDNDRRRETTQGKST
jgi:hypothetical protein